MEQDYDESSDEFHAGAKNVFDKIGGVDYVGVFDKIGGVRKLRRKRILEKSSSKVNSLLRRF